MRNPRMDDGKWQKDVGYNRTTLHGPMRKQMRRWQKGLLKLPEDCVILDDDELAEHLQREHEQRLAGRVPNTKDMIEARLAGRKE